MRKILRNTIFTIIIALIITSCSSTVKVNEHPCKPLLRNNHKTILIDKFKSIVGNDTLYLNEVKYECVFTVFYLKKGMYDRFGKWNQVIYPEGEYHPILLWKNVKLFPNDTTEFTVATSGEESAETIYASALVFDKKNNDLLSDDSEYQTKLIEYFSKMIKKNNAKKRDFYDIYWKMVDPNRWRKNKKYREYIKLKNNNSFDNK
jgi:hypothetical protein